MRKEPTAEPSAEKGASVGLTGASAKAFADAVVIVDGVFRGWIADLMSLKGSGKARELNKEMLELHFDSGEFLKILVSIADGEFTNSEVETLAELLQSTAASVDGTLLSLREDHREFLNARYGAQFWNRVDKKVRLMKNNIREDISKLGQMKGSKMAKGATAAEILNKIEEFNNDLTLICENISPPLRKPKSS
jgi:hypothetical protein